MTQHSYVVLYWQSPDGTDPMLTKAQRRGLAAFYKAVPYDVVASFPVSEKELGPLRWLKVRKVLRQAMRQASRQPGTKTVDLS